MFSFALIVFREILEVALVLSILLAATTNLQGRGKWLTLGLLLGTGGSLIVAYFTEQISVLAEGMGQEVFNASVLLIAASLIGFTVVWMNTHAKQMAAHVKEVGKAVREGTKPLYMLTVVVGLGMLREGSEIALLSHGILASGVAVGHVLLGGLAGLIAGMLVGFGIYKGIIRAATKHLFRISSYLLIALCAGMVTQALGLFAAADMLPTLVPTVWDTSGLVSESSILGQALHAMVGYTARPSGIQLLGYFLTCLVLVPTLQHKSPQRPMPNAVAA